MTNGKETFTNEIDFSDYDKQKDLTVMENRYDKYKDSGIAWIGEIPEHWEVCKLSTLFFQHKQRNNDTQESNLLSLSYGNIKKKDINTSEGLLPESFENYNIIDKDDIVFRLTDLQNDKKSLRSALCRERGIITSAYVTIRKRGNVNSSYFNYLFRAYDECKVFYGLGDGVRQGMNFDDLRKLEILLPQQIIQQAIADYLDRRCSEIDDLIALQEEMITKLQSYKQSVITEAVTRGLDKNLPLKDSGIDWIGKVPEHWKVKRLKGIYSFGKGLNITKADLIDNGIPVISYGQLHSKLNTGTCIKDCLIRYVPEIFLENNSASLVKQGDVIFADTSEDLEGCGNCIYIDRDMLLYAGYHTIIAKNISSYHNKYFSYLFQTDCWRFQIRRMVNGVKLFSIPQRLLASTNIITPSIQEQQAIADYLDQRCSEIDELIALKQQKIEKLKEYKKSLIFECVTGKRKVS